MAFFRYLPETVGFLLFIMMSTQVPQIGPILLLLEAAFVFLLLVIKRMEALAALKRYWWLLSLPLIATMSFIWSDVPAISLRYGAQFVFTAICGIVLAYLMTPRRFVLMLLYSTFIFCVLCVLYGRQGTSAEGMVLIGLTGSKNQIAYEAQILFSLGVTALLMGQISIATRWIAILSMPFAVYLLAGTNSATAILMAFGGCAVLVGVWMSQSMTPGARLATIAGAVIILAPLFALAPEAKAFVDHFMYDTLNKDPTLTGRTVLWEHADALIARRPWLGYGYYGVWMGNSAETIGLMRLFDVSDGRQFHFHNTFRQVSVDEGMLGFIALVGTMAAVTLGSLRRLLLTPNPANTFFFTAFLLLVIRAFTDNIIGPFSIHTMMFFAAGVYAFAPLASDVKLPVAAPARKPREGTLVRHLEAFRDSPPMPRFPDRSQ